MTLHTYVSSDEDADRRRHLPLHVQAELLFDRPAEWFSVGVVVDPRELCPWGDRFPYDW